MSFPFREPVLTCQPNTYKYFFPEEQVFDIWEHLSQRYGSIQSTSYMMEIHSPRFIFRSTSEGNPIIVIRRRRCQPVDVEELHQLFEFVVFPNKLSG
jgi:hypothetical protein